MENNFKDSAERAFYPVTTEEAVFLSIESSSWKLSSSKDAARKIFLSAIIINTKGTLDIKATA